MSVPSWRNSAEIAFASCAAQAETRRPGTVATSAISVSGILLVMLASFPV
ncbi:MAG TPA: hypothetical protein VGS06_44450 [Streptosporangiaceae bacterium]|nr:hypothetical protein [Streptosporangiaceae bacterium]